MKLVENILTKNPCFTAGQKIKVRGLMLHSVGCPQPKASVFMNNWNKSSYDNACVHGFIDANDGTVYQTLPWNHRGWHCGRSGNNTHIGVEMCEPSTIQYTRGSSFNILNKNNAVAATQRTYNSAVELFAYLCKEYNLNPLEPGVIVSHKEGNALGIASNHGDPEHLWRGLGLSYTMDGFRADVNKAMGNVEVKPVVKEMYRIRKSWEDAKSQIGAYSVLENAVAACKEGYKVFDSLGQVVFTREYNTAPNYKVRVAVDALNIRRGPGTNYKTNGCIRDRGIYTIVETNGDWGRLKSGAGWIHLDYCQKV